MAELYRIVDYGFQCDRCQYEVVDEKSEGDRQHYIDKAIKLGWRMFANRSLRYYCPNCEPSLGSKQFEVTNRLGKRL